MEYNIKSALHYYFLFILFGKSTKESYKGNPLNIHSKYAIKDISDFFVVVDISSQKLSFENDKWVVIRLQSIYFFR